MITIYTKVPCSFCEDAKALLKNRNMEYNEVLVGGPEYTVENFKEDFTSKGITTVPQIFMNTQRIGGYTELVEYFKVLDEAQNDAIDKLRMDDESIIGRDEE